MSPIQNNYISDKGIWIFIAIKLWLHYSKTLKFDIPRPSKKLDTNIKAFKWQRINASSKFYLPYENKVLYCSCKFNVFGHN